MGPYKIVHLMQSQFSVTVASSVVTFMCTETIKLFNTDVQRIPIGFCCYAIRSPQHFGTRVGNFLSALSLKVGYS